MVSAGEPSDLTRVVSTPPTQRNSQALSTTKNKVDVNTTLRTNACNSLPPTPNTEGEGTDNNQYRTYEDDSNKEEDDSDKEEGNSPEEETDSPREEDGESIDSECGGTMYGAGDLNI